MHSNNISAFTHLPAKSVLSCQPGNISYCVIFLNPFLQSLLNDSMKGVSINHWLRNWVTHWVISDAFLKCKAEYTANLTDVIPHKQNILYEWMHIYKNNAACHYGMYKKPCMMVHTDMHIQTCSHGVVTLTRLVLVLQFRKNKIKINNRITI